MQQHNNDATKQFMVELGKIIKKHRVAQRKTIYNISAECSLNKSTWRAVEIGYSRNIQLITLWKIAEGLDIEPATLLHELKERMGKDFVLSISNGSYSSLNEIAVIPSDVFFNCLQNNSES